MDSVPDTRYSEIPVDPCLAPFVRLIWTLETSGPVAFGPPERILPDGVVEVIFHYGTPFDMRFRDENFTGQPASFLVSQTGRFLDLRPAGRSGFIAVRFQPWGAYHFFSVPVAEFVDRMIPAEGVWGQDARILEERVHAARDIDERSTLVQRFLLDQLRRYHKEPVERLVRAIWSRRGRMRVASLCREIGVTQRGLERTFSRALGVSPKQFARLTRFLCACRLLRNGKWTTLAEVAHAAGYYDQAHCIADFKAFSGMTPRAFCQASKVAVLDVD